MKGTIELYQCPKCATYTIATSVEENEDFTKSVNNIFAKLKADNNAAYAERNKLVAALSRLYPSELGYHEGPEAEWDPNWMNVVFVNTPHGQLSWHIHKDELPMFAHLQVTKGDANAMVWDGHTTEEKYSRLAKCSREDFK